MALSPIVVVLFLQGVVQLGLVDGVDFDGKARRDLAINPASISAFEDWVAHNASTLPRSVSFCIIEPDLPDDNALSIHLMERLATREDAGELDVYSSHKNVMSSSASSEYEGISFRKAAAYCLGTFLSRM